MDRGTADPAEILGDDVTLDAGVRRASDISVEPDVVDAIEALLDARRDEVAAFFALPLVEREGAAFLRYGRGGMYRAHRDRGDLPSWPGALRRQVAVVIFLNDGFAGGVLRLLDLGIDIVPREGTLVAFDASTLHEVTEVVSGTRDAIVDWFY